MIQLTMIVWCNTSVLLLILCLNSVAGLRRVILPVRLMNKPLQLNQLADLVYPSSHRKSTTARQASVLSMPFEELADRMDGIGKARIVWNNLRKGKSPLLAEYLPEEENKDNKENTAVIMDSNDKETLSLRAQYKLRQILNATHLIPNTLLTESLALDGTRKLLLRLADGLEIESVLIPSVKHDRTTICISTQVGCDRACAFCLTGTMGLVRNLTADEMVGQVIRGISLAQAYAMPIVSNVVFMGMGDSGRNVQEVGKAVGAMTDPQRLSLGQSKVTVSTVGPSPEIFMEIARMNCTIAWSLHACDEGVRRKLVPSSKYSPAALRDGLIRALETRSSIRMRTIMIALTLIEGVNDREEDALQLADFLLPVLKVAPKIAIDLIPYNDINVEGFRKPSRERVNAFQEVLRKKGYFCTVRVTRGDDESAACGMLATQSTKKNVAKQLHMQ